MATHSSILAWRIPWTEEPSGLQSMGLQRVRHDRSNIACTNIVFNGSLWPGGLLAVIQGSSVDQNRGSRYPSTSRGTETLCCQDPHHAELL